jgi:hypothetical protein
MVGAALASSVLFAACGQSTGLSSSSDLVNAVLANGGQTADRVALDNAEEELTGKCMERLGYEFFPTLETTSDVGAIATQPESPLSLQYRTSNGYGIYQTLVQQAQAAGTTQTGANGVGDTTNRQTLYVRGLSKAKYAQYLLALGGTKRKTYSLINGGKVSDLTGGCVGRARKEVYGSIANFVTVFSGLPSLTNEVEDEVYSSSAYQSAMSSWSRCMSNLDFKFSSPGLAEQSIYELYSKKGLTQVDRRQEIAVSLADFHCASRSDLESTFDSSMKRAAGDLSGSLQRQALIMIQLQKQALSRAKSLLEK